MLPVSQLKMLVYVSLFLVVLSTAKLCHGAAADASARGQQTPTELDGSSDAMRHKRGPTVGLFAFPRVGRSDPELVDWGEAALPVELADDYGDYSIREYKRQGLVPFPRVGRSGPSLARFWPKSMQQKRAGNSGASSGMWFGPRLGKRANAAASEIKGNEVYTPRLGRSYFSRLVNYERQFQSSLPIPLCYFRLNPPQTKLSAEIPLPSDAITITRKAGESLFGTGSEAFLINKLSEI
ncbi:uncharacterized protein LOC128746312 [Sabethes cyaneus]|uniref:uncharacterized protein LOC128746312 n=1 Tax=Sabethes cyaneus TaxID=53552 RepID=UPI00237D517F|nr:uncharacterized protein LOC128746312 [Sabethes cyaneus]